MSEIIDHLVVYDNYGNIHAEIFDDNGLLKGYSYTLQRKLTKEELIELLKEILGKDGD